jgi:hypothetical protein
MNAIGLVPRYSSPLPIVADRRSGSTDRRRALDRAIVIDLSPADTDIEPRPSALSAPDPSGWSVSEVRQADAAREILTYEVIARLGADDGFGEKGRALNQYF